MGKSLTETARAVLMNESNDPSPDAGAKSTNPNMASLRPNSKYVDGRFATFPGHGETVPARWNPPDGQEHHIETQPVVTTNDGQNIGSIVSAPVKKDKSVKTSVAAQPAEKMMEEEEIEEEILEENEDLEEDIEISEELEAFIDQCLEEGMSEEEIAEAIEENFEILEEDVEEDLEEDVDYEYTVDMSEHVAALFEGEDLSEDFKQKAIAIFEAAVTSTVKSELAAIEEAYAATLEEEVNELKEELSSNVDDYLNYVVENWVSENEVAIEAGLRTELTEEFISGLRNLFAENYIDIPEDKISVVEELGNKVADLENKLNEEIERNVELNAILSESKKTEVMYAMTEGLTVTQAEKLKSLAENVEFTSEEEYTNKVATLRESYFPSSITAQTQLDYIEPGTEGKAMISEGLEGPMARYVQVLGKKLPN